MPLGLAPLSNKDYQVMGYHDRNVFSDHVYNLDEANQRFVINATHRLADTVWLARTLDDQVQRMRGPAITEGLLSLQFYLLLTCADTMGHICSRSQRVGTRFRAFFQTLSQEAQHQLAEVFLVWRTNWDELVLLGLADPQTRNATCPSRSQIEQHVRCLSDGERIDAVIGFLYYVRRNPYTHEAEYPQIGWHPNLSVLQMQRLGVPNVATLGELDHIQVGVDNEKRYFVYYNTDDPIAELRWVVIRRLGEIVKAGQGAVV